MALSPLQPRTRWVPAALFACALALSGCAGAQRPSHNGSQPAFIDARLIVIVRHGEVDTASKRAQGNQTQLTAQGERTALELAQALGDAGVTRIVTSQAERTLETAQPLAARLGLKLESPFAHLPGHNLDGAALAEAKQREAREVADYLAATSKPGDVVLLVYHHSVIPGLLRELGYASEPEFDEQTEYDRLYVVVPDRDRQSYRVMRLRYGSR